jgi:serine/threonine protein kinase
MNIPNYTIVRKIGEGGMANVYLGRHNILQKNVAIKVLKSEFNYNEDVRKRFLSEARMLFEMSHPNIIKVTDMTDEADVAAFVMEYVDGESLKEYIERKGILKAEEIRSLFAQILQAVGYIHEQGYVHRDLKPSNFMVDGSTRIKLLDFGISKVLKSDSPDHNMTGTFDRMGTPVYMSPEQVKSAKVVTQHSDIYSLGVLLWHMVTGRKPYDSSTMSAFEIQTKIVNEDLSPTGSKWDAVIERATEKSPPARFDNCSAFMSAIDDAMDDVTKVSKSKRVGINTERKSSDQSSTQVENVKHQDHNLKAKIENVDQPISSIKTASSPVKSSSSIWNPVSVLIGIVVVVALFFYRQEQDKQFWEQDLATADSSLFGEVVDSASASRPENFIVFKNNTQETVYVSVAYNNYGMESHGWYEIKKNKTFQVNIPHGVTNREVFWYVEGEYGYTSPGYDAYFCVNHPEAFDYVTEEESLNCNDENKVGFKKVIIKPGSNSIRIK